MQRNWQRFRQARQSLIGLIREEEVRGLTAFLCAIAICDGLLLGYMLHASNSPDSTSIATAIKPEVERPHLVNGCMPSPQLTAKLVHVSAAEPVALAVASDAKECPSQPAKLIDH